jgi:AhpD family alkylhydroperoxidase
MTGKKFRKRIYSGPDALLRDAFFLFRNARNIPGCRMPRAFRERLILTVSAVNSCRYCSFFHSRAALLSGISTEEIASLSDRAFDSTPPEEIPALLYAQHWAESDGNPEKQAMEKFANHYDKKKSECIEYILRSARMANLLGNSFDYVLYKLSLGRIGG